MAGYLEMKYEYFLLCYIAGVSLLTGADLMPGQTACPVTTTTIASPSHPEFNLTFEWPETMVDVTARAPCPCGNLTGRNLEELNRFANRICQGNLTVGVSWSEGINVSECSFTDVSQDICQASTLPLSSLVLEELENITEQADLLDSADVTGTVNILEMISNEILEDEELSDAFLTVVDHITEVQAANLLESNEDANSSQRILELLERVSEAYPIPANKSSVCLARRHFAVAVQRVDWTSDFLRSSGQSFHVDPVENSTELSLNNLELALGRERNATVSIFLPPELFQGVTRDFNLISSNSEAYVTIAYTAFASNFLFQGRGEGNSILFNNTNFPADRMVIAASVSDGYRVEELEDEVLITFLRDPDSIGSSEMESLCTFWDFNGDDGYGGWSDEECELDDDISSDAIVVCSCEHLTHFTFLTVEEEIQATLIAIATQTLEAVIFVGGVIASLCMLFTILTYVTSQKLRSTTHGKLLLNLCFALLAIYLTLILADVLPKYRIPCAVTAALLHYFVLVMSLAMASQAVILYLKLVIVFTVEPRYYPLKAAIISWSLPIVVVGVTVGVGYQDYLDAGDERGLCIAVDYSFFFGYAFPLGVIFLFNWTVFVVIMVSLCYRQRKMNRMSEVKSQQQKVKTSQQFWAALSLSVLLGLGWGFGLAVTERLPTIAYYTVACTFVAFACLQGLFIFLLQCVRNPEARKHWRETLLSCWKVMPSIDKSVSTSSTYIGRKDRKDRGSSQDQV